MAARRGSACFYERRVALVRGYLRRRVGPHPDVALDLVAETFARALEHRVQFDPAHGSAVSWLLGITHHLWRTPCVAGGWPMSLGGAWAWSGSRWMTSSSTSLSAIASSRFSARWPSCRWLSARRSSNGSSPRSPTGDRRADRLLRAGPPKRVSRGLADVKPSAQENTTTDPYRTLGEQLLAAAHRQEANHRAAAAVRLVAVAPAERGCDGGAARAGGRRDRGRRDRRAHGQPGEPSRGRPSANAGIGIPAPGGSRLLALRAPDPQGGLPWGMRLVHTTRGRDLRADRAP